MRWLVWTISVAGSLGCTSLHPVSHQALYRSKQLSPAELERAVDRYGVRTVVNLRGFQPRERWYRDQVEVCLRLGLKHFDVDVRASQLDREEIIRLLEVYRSAPRPILIESKRGAGNLGFAAGLYRLAFNDEGYNQAKRELAFWQSRRLPVESCSAFDRFLHDWKDTDDFYQNYGLDAGRTTELPRAVIDLVGGIDATDNAATAATMSAAKPSGQAQSRVRKLSLDDVEITTGLFQGAGTGGYHLRGSRLENGRWLNDYSAVIVSGPVSDGPMIVGRAPRASHVPTHVRGRTESTGRRRQLRPPTLGTPIGIPESVNPR